MTNLWEQDSGGIKGGIFEHNVGCSKVNEEQFNSEKEPIMNRLMWSIMCSTLLFGAVGVSSPVHAEVNLNVNIPFVISPPGVAVAPAVVIGPEVELYPWVYGAPYGYWAGGVYGGHYWREGHYGHPQWRGPNRTYGEQHYQGHPGHDHGRERR